MLVVLSGFKIMGKIEMAGAMFLPNFVLTAYHRPGFKNYQGLRTRH
jgi:hypothetical protein